MRRRKLLLALQAVKRACSLEPASPEAHTLLLRFCHAVQKVRGACMGCPSFPACVRHLRAVRACACSISVLPLMRAQGLCYSSTLCQ